MEFRFWLRFETGERSGDRVPVPTDGLTVGRRTDNGLVLSDASVSGRHARFVVMGGTVVLEDLGSTNGTRVEGKRIDSVRLAPGDQLRLGAVEFTFYDEGGEDQSSPSEPAAASAPGEELVLEEGGIALEGEDELFSAEDAGEELGSVSADLLARSGSRSALVGVLLLVVGVGGAGAWWWFGRGAAEESARRVVADVPGNLLRNPSFESDGGWETDESAPDTFFQAPAWRVSGEAGLGAALDAGDWARSWSAVVTVAPGRGLRLQAVASAAGAARFDLGVELSSSSGLFAPLLVQAPPIPSARSMDAGETGDAGEAEVELQLELPHLAGCDRARVVLLARAGSAEGEAAVDDLALVLSDAAPGPAATFQEMEFHALGRPPLSAALTRIDRVLLGNLVSATEAGEARALETVALESGVRLRAAGAGRFTGTVAPSVARQGVATLGRAGYQTRPLDFEAEGVTDLLVGDRIDLMRFQFASPVKVTGRGSDGSLAFEARGPGAEEVLLQLEFREERGRAARLAEEARGAERTGDLGGAIARWSELLDELPFDTRLVTEAGNARGRLIQQGLDEVGELEAALERARFFRLPGLFDEVRTSAQGVSAIFSGSPVAEAAHSLVLAVEQELGAYDRGEGTAGAQRLESVLEGSGEWADGLLGQHLRAELERLRAEGGD